MTRRRSTARPRSCGSRRCSTSCSTIPIASDASRFSIEPDARAPRRAHDDRAAIRSGSRRRARASSTSAIPVWSRLDPRWYQAALRFVALGFAHILDGIDHLLFILCLVIPFRKMRPLVAIITSFTVAHSITLIASALGFAPDGLWFPPLIEVLIALSIVYMALENIVGARLERRWLIAFGFGLVHGFGFSFALRESMQFAGRHLATSLVSFNVGVELGQLLVLALAVPALALRFKHVVAERMGTIILSAFVAHTAWHWMLDRGAQLGQYRFRCRRWMPRLLASVLRGLMLLLIVVGAGMGDVRALPAAGSRPAKPRIRASRPASTRTDASHVYRRTVDDVVLACMLSLVQRRASLQAQTAKDPTKAAAHQRRRRAVDAERRLHRRTGQSREGRVCGKLSSRATSRRSHTGATFAKWWRGKQLSDLFDVRQHANAEERSGQPGGRGRRGCRWRTC